MIKKAEKIYLGNVITMDSVKPRAEAVAVKDGKILYVGSEKNAIALSDSKTEILDYKDQTIYPGFIESHTHASSVGSRAIGQADLNGLPPNDMEAYAPVIKKFIEDNPDQELYIVAGWAETDGEELTHVALDEILDTKPLLMNSTGGHSLLLNTKAMEKWDITAERAQKEGTELIHVDENGQPTGYLCEAPAINIVNEVLRMTSVAQAKEYIKYWQNFAFEHGFTGATDAGTGLVIPNDEAALNELDAENNLKLYIYSYMICPDNVDDPKKEVEKAKKLQDNRRGCHNVIVGIKAFLDGVMEARTSWMTTEYADEPGYFGNQRFNDKDKMVELIAEAAKYNMPVHVHSEGNGATDFMLDCIEEAQKQTGNMDQRNVLAHLHFVEEKDFKRISDTNSVAVVPPTWAPAIPGLIDAEISSIGEDLASKAYPIKSFFDAGACTVFHSDYPVGGLISIQESIYCAVTRTKPALEEYIAQLPGSTKELFEASTRGPEEAITREQSLRAQTINVAKMLHAEDKVGSLEIGKIANMTIFDTDFLTCPTDKIMDAQVIATIVDGDVVYRKD